jgi:uncharacterized membrane protein
VDDARLERADRLRPALRWVLAAGLLFAGVMHLVSTESFLGQVPTWLPARLFIVRASGVVEIALGFGLLVAVDRRRDVGWALAAFFVLVFPGNVYQAVAGTDAFGLDTPGIRWLRLAFQPVLIVWALWSTGAIGARARTGVRRSRRARP